MLKFATAQIIAAALGEQQERFSKAAHRAVFHYEARPGYLYVRSRAISSRCNENWDEFPAAEIEASYRTFIGKPVFVNHVNDNHRRARGVVIDAALHKDRNPDGTPDTWAEVLMEIDAVRFPKLAKAILKGEVDRTSMGCDVERSVCSACGNEARTPAEYCSHIPHLKGKRIFRATAAGKKVGELVRETCYGLRFFENSVLVEPPADPTAHFLGVDSSGLGKAASTGTMTVRPQERSVEPTHGDGGPPPPMEDWGGGDGGAKNQFLITKHRPDYYSLINGVEHDHPQRVTSYHDSTEDALHALGHLQQRGSYSPSEVRYAPKMNAKRTTSMEPEYHNHYGKWFDKNSPNHDPNPHVESAHEDMSDEELRRYMEGAHSAKAGADIGKLRAQHAWTHNNNDWFEGPQGPGQESTCLSSRGKPCNYRSPGGHTHAPSFKGMFGDTDLSGLMDDGHGPSKFSGLGKTAAKKKPAPKAVEPELDEYGTPKPKRGQPYEPASDHPWYKQVPLHHSNIVDHWDKATDEEKDAGMRWYSDAHHVARAIARLDSRIKTDEEAAHKGAGVLSAYSPRTNWPMNMFNAAHSFRRQAAVRPLKDDPDKPARVATMGMHADKAQRIMDGEHHQPVLKAPKTQDFAHLIEHGGYEPQNDEEKASGAPRRLSGRVVVDRHALSVAAGRRITDVENDAHSGFPGASSSKHARHYYEHAAEQYRNAAAAISEKEGKPVAAHHVQAVTWLVRQRLNTEEDQANANANARNLGKGRSSAEEKIKGHWSDFAAEHAPELKEKGNSHVARAVDASAVLDDGTVSGPASRRTAALDNTDTLVGGNKSNEGSHHQDWFHGTSHKFTHFEDPAHFSPEYHDPYDEFGGGDDGYHDGPEGSHLSGTGHWNTRLGAHFAADHTVADQFAGEDGRVVHARLHLKNPKQYFSEYDMDHEVHTDEHARGNHITHHLADTDDEYISHDDFEAELHRGDNQRGPYKKDHWQLGRNRPMATSWVNSHPDREAMADRFKQKLMDQGHDGIVYRNEIEKGKGSRWTAIAFHPHQIEVSHIHHVGAPHPSPEEAEAFRRHYPGHGQTELPIHARLNRVIDATYINHDGTIRAVAYGEVKAPQDVDTLREEACPVCGDNATFDGMQCQVCGFINPPEQFRDPDLDRAKTLDLRKQLVDPSLIDDNGELQRVQDDGTSMPPDGQEQQGLEDEQAPQSQEMIDPSQLDENGLPPSPYGDQSLDGTQRGGPAVSDRNGDGLVDPGEVDPDGNVNLLRDSVDPEQGGQPGPRELPGRAKDRTGDPFTPGPDMPYATGPEGPINGLDDGQDSPYGKMPEPMMGQPGDGIPDLLCPNCGFAADATMPQSQNMGRPGMDGIVSGDVCPSCQRAQLLTPGQINSNYSKSPAVERTPWS